MINRIFRYILYLITIVFIPIIITIIILLRSFVIIRFLSVPTNRIGHFAANVEMYLSKRTTNKNSSKYYDVAFYQKTISNNYLAKMWKRKLNVYPNNFVFPVYYFINFLSKYFNFFKKHIKETPSFESRDYDNILDRLSPEIEFKKEEINYGIEELKKFGLNKYSKFVCFIIRDQEYLKRMYPKTDWSYWDYRDYDVDRFLLAAEELTKLGYYVFRMGKITNKIIKTNNEMIIDYSKSNLKSDFLDIYIGANCEFCLSTDVGYDHIPYIFRKPLASITDPISLIKFSSKKFLSIFSYYYSIHEKKNLSVEEIFQKKIAYFSKKKDLKTNGIKLIQPDQNQIRDLALDMASYIKNNFKLSKEDETLQDSFLNIYKSNINSENFINNFKSQLIAIPELNNFTLHKKYFGRISPSFLRKNEFLYK